jgi:hypothetical protein
MKQPAFATVEEAFIYRRDLDASLSERLDAFAEASRAHRHPRCIFAVEGIESS